MGGHLLGPPASGKTTLCRALLSRFARAVHLPVDDMREWVVSGAAGPVPWTDETERQYQIAERAACAVARTYQDAGFVVAIDHCRNPQRLEELIQAELAARPVVKICLVPDLSVNLERAHSRTNKDFAVDFLDGIIESTNVAYRRDVPTGWHLIDNSAMRIGATAETILSWCHT